MVCGGVINWVWLWLECLCDEWDDEDEEEKEIGGILVVVWVGWVGENCGDFFVVVGFKGICGFVFFVVV